MRVLVTGGAGFVGSHQSVALLQAGHEVCVIDDLSNSERSIIRRIGEAAQTSPPRFVCASVLDTARVAETLVGFSADAVIHFAAFKHVWESVEKPVEYLNNNIAGLTSVLAACDVANVRRLVFSSSGSVYGETDRLPISETEPHKPTNPYSSSKSIGEHILEELCKHDPRWSVIALRYFNPAGAHPSGLLGESPTAPPTNLLPALLRAVVSDEPTALVHGADFNTPDGSGVRDYVHVMDVADCHLRALEIQQSGGGFSAVNIGRGVGVSVLEMIAAVEAASHRQFDVVVGPRRSGDVSALYADTTLARRQLGDITYRSLAQICEDAWRWESRQGSVEMAQP